MTNDIKVKQEQRENEILKLNNNFSFISGDLKPKFIWDNNTLLKINFKGNGGTHFKFSYNVRTKCLSFRHKVQLGGLYGSNEYWFVTCNSRIDNVEIDELCFTINSIMNDLG